MKIEELKAGDIVFAYDSEKNQVTERRVERLFQNYTYTWVHISINGETIKATRSHPVWIEDEQRWVAAAELKPGLAVRLRDNSCAVIEAVEVEHLSKPETTYNFSVAQDHTYFVGSSAILVHNQQSQGPTFIVDPGGTVYPVPTGATGPTPVINPAGNQTGVAFTGGSGGANGQVSTMRIMDPVTSGKYQYPDGYVKYENANGQGVDPYTGKTGSKPDTHFPMKPAPCN
jgi:hypothetical protein